MKELVKWSPATVGKGLLPRLSGGRGDFNHSQGSAGDFKDSVKEYTMRKSCYLLKKGTYVKYGISQA